MNGKKKEGRRVWGIMALSNGSKLLQHDNQAINVANEQEHTTIFIKLGNYMGDIY